MSSDKKDKVEFSGEENWILNNRQAKEISAENYQFPELKFNRNSVKIILEIIIFPISSLVLILCLILQIAHVTTPCSIVCFFLLGWVILFIIYILLSKNCIKAIKKFFMRLLFTTKKNTETPRKTNFAVNNYYYEMFRKNTFKNLENSLSPKIPLAIFPTSKEEKKLKEALEKAHDIRKFEIELLWKRSSYFWVFIAFLFVAYGVTLTTCITNYDKIDSFLKKIYTTNTLEKLYYTGISQKIEKEEEYSLTISFSNKETTTKKTTTNTNSEETIPANSENTNNKHNPNIYIFSALTFINILGIIISLLWYEIVNSSKRCYESWEKHIDMLEFHVTGNLHKVVFSGDTNSLQVASLSKITALSCEISFWVWIILQIFSYIIFHEHVNICYLLEVYILFVIIYIRKRNSLISSSFNSNPNQESETDSTSNSNINSKN